MQFVVHISGLDETMKGFDTLKTLLADMTDAMVEIGELLAGPDGYFSEAPFVTRGDVLDDPWRALKTTTIREKTRHAGSIMAGVSPSQPLVQSGKMQHSFRFVPTTNSVFIDNSVDYWKYHQTGTEFQGDVQVPPGHTGRGKNLPRRMTLGINDPVKAIISDAVQKSVQTKIAEAMNGS